MDPGSPAPAVPRWAAGAAATVLVDSTTESAPEGPLRGLGVTAYLATPLRLRTIPALAGGPMAVDGGPEPASRASAHLLVGSSAPMERLRGILERVGPSQATVLIVGESGSGKELVARTLHDISPRRQDPFVPVNCGALTPSLMESELFGHERGSFTGADRRHRGFFERANGGTLFLDEITEMPIELQVKLLRVLESGMVVGVGREDPTAVDVRVVAATNRDPREAVRKGRLREDLYYRLRVLQVEVPPLRDRLDDVPELARTFLAEIAAREGRGRTLADETLAALARHTWPGNVRELRNALYTMFLLAQDEEIPLSALPPEIRRAVFGGGLPEWRRNEATGRPLRDIEKQHILLTLEELDGHKRRAAEVLGISLKTLYNRLNDYRAEGEGGAGSGPAGLGGGHPA